VTDGKNTSAADFANLPINGRGVANIAAITPGVINSTIRGGQSNHTQWLIDGVDVMDPVTGGGVMYLNEETIQEVQVVTGGATADMGRFTGGMVNVVTKSGTNKFQGTTRFEITNPNWQAMRPMASKADSQHSTIQMYHVSGPIWKDHIFFSAGYRNVSPIAKTATKTSAPAEYGGQRPIVSYRTDERMDFKLDWHITPYHRVFGLYNNTKMDRFGIDYAGMFFGGSTSWETLSAQPDEYGNMAFGYVGTLADNLVIKANYGKKNERLGGPGGGGQGGPGIITMIDNGESGAVYDNGVFGFDSDSRPVDNGTLSANWFLDSPFGSHDLKFGLDYFKSSRNAANAQSPTDYFVYFSGWINDPTTHGTEMDNRLFDEDSMLVWYPTFKGATNSNTIWSYYVNDKIKFNDRISANIGLRVDKFDSVNDIKAKNFDITAFSPRLTAIYDPFANSRWIFELGYNSYAGQIMQGATDGASVVGNPAEYGYGYTGGPGNDPNSYQDLLWVYNPELYRHSNLIDPNMKPPTMNEISLVARFNDGRRGYYSLSFSTRKWKNFVSSWLSEQEYPIDDEDRVLTLIANDPLLKRDYKGIEFQWEKQFTDSFNWGGNLTLSETMGNFEGGQTGSSGPLRAFGPLGMYKPTFNSDGALIGAYQPTEQQLAPYGRLSNDRPLTIRTWGTWQKDVFGAGHINLGFLAEYNSGAPYSNAVTAQLRNYVGGIYGTTYTRYFSQRGAMRFNSYYNTSVQVSYDHAIWKGVRAFGTLNITNFFNHQIQVDWNTSGTAAYNSGTSGSPSWMTDYYNRPVLGGNTAGTARFLPGPTYGQPTGQGNFIGGRNLQFILGLRF
jgi:hypothetical protein